MFRRSLSSMRVGEFETLLWLSLGVVPKTKANDKMTPQTLLTRSLTGSRGSCDAAVE